jgi:hypothetical protein
MHKNISFRFLPIVCSILFAAGCASTYSTRSVEKSGFLGDYSQLQEDPADDIQLLYVKPGVDFSRYNKIVMDPVTVYATKDSGLGKLANEDISALLNFLDASIRHQLTNRFEFVSQPQEDALHLRAALTDARGAKVAMDLVSTVIPIGLAVSSAKRVALGKHSAIGQAGVEVEILDAKTHERLLALVDERAGRKVTLKLDKFRKWRSVEDAANYWSGIIAQQLGAKEK